MARILVLTDRPQSDDALVSRAANLAQCLEARDVSVVVTRSRVGLVPSGYSLGVPDAGAISQDSSSLWMFMLDQGDDRIASDFLARCRQQVRMGGLQCETARSSTSLQRTAAMLDNVVGLMVVSRETLLGDPKNAGKLGRAWCDVQRPWLICSSNSMPWNRVVVATRDDCPQGDLVTWGRHWSGRIGIPVAMIKLQNQPRQSFWSALVRSVRWKSRSQHRDEVLAGLRACGLGPSDLLIVDREAAIWPGVSPCCQVSLDDIVAAAPCSVAVAPKVACVASCELLFPRSLHRSPEQECEIVAV